MVSIEDLDPLQKVQDFIASGDTFLQNARPIKSILESIPIAENVLEGIENTIKTLGNVSFLQWNHLPKLITDFIA